VEKIDQSQAQLETIESAQDLDNPTSRPPEAFIARRDLLNFIFNWELPLKLSMKLVKDISKLISPENQKELDNLTKAIIDHRAMAELMVTELKKEYLDRVEPVWDEISQRLTQGPTVNQIPNWARLKNLDDPKTLYKVWKDCDLLETKIQATLKWARQLYSKESQKG
jgi:hypothetical protein